MSEEDNGRIKLNLGCGEDVRKDYVNIDIRDLDGVDKVLNIKKGLPYEDNTVSKILARDILEHFSYNITHKILKEWRRVLAPGGILEIRVPDYAKIISSSEDFDTKVYLLFGGQENKGDYHKTAFTRRRLRHYLKNNGFKAVKVFERNPLDYNFWVHARAKRKERH